MRFEVWSLSSGQVCPQREPDKHIWQQSKLSTEPKLLAKSADGHTQLLPSLILVLFMNRKGAVSCIRSCCQWEMPIFHHCQRTLLQMLGFMCYYDNLLTYRNYAILLVGLRNSGGWSESWVRWQVINSRMLAAAPERTHGLLDWVL